jgi:hypothetical protein
VPVVLEELLNHLVRYKPEEQPPEEVAIIAWSVAVLDLKRVDVYDWLMRGLDHHSSGLEANFRRQAHQFLLTCELNGFPAHHSAMMASSEVRDAEETGSRRRAAEEEERRQEQRQRCEEEVRADYGATHHRPSRLQRDVACILAEMRISFVEEYVEEKSGYSLDIMLSDKRTAIEVDGPSHYAAGTHRPLGNTNMKHRHLAQLGYDLRILPYW